MSTTIEAEGQPSGTALEDELHDLEAQEAALERRTRTLEFAGPLALVFSFLALGIGMGALVLAMGKGSENTTGPAMMGSGATRPTGMMSSSASSGMMMGAGRHGSFTSAQTAAAAHGKVYVQLGGYWAAPTVSSVRAGGRMTLRLSPGTYMLFCNAPGHYAAGQHILFDVTKS